MKRTALLPALFVAVVACTGDEEPGIVPRVLIENPGQPFNLALSPDGTRLAWAMTVDGDAKIFVANADGGDRTQITDGVWDARPTWSPDGRWIAYSAETPDFDVFVVPSAGGEARQLTSGPGRDQPAGWLPDGSGIVFHRTGVGAAHALVVPLEGGPARRLVPARDGNQWVTVSPDGSRVAFDLHRGGEGTIWVQDLAGGSARQITTEGLENGLPTRNMWSPDGKWLAYGSRRTGTWDLWVANVETGELRQITTDIRNDQGYRWSPDGQWIAFVSDRGGQWDVWIAPSTGGPAARVTRDLARESDLAWSPDGRRLYYAQQEGGSALHAVRVLDGHARVLVDWRGFGSGIVDVDIAVDGRSVLFSSDRSGNWDVWSVPLSGGEPKPFTASSLDDDSPRFSPDGRQVLFNSNRAGSWDLWVMPAQGGDARQLTDWPSSERGAQWSPDGAMVAFVSDRDASQGDVWVMPAAGGGATRLTHTDTGAQGLGWSPDGQSVYYVGLRPDSTRALYRVPARGGRSVPLEASPGIRGGTLSPDGSSYAYENVVGGWAYIEVTSTSGGGAPRRLTSRERAYEGFAVWSSDGSWLALADADFAGEFTVDVMIMSWPAGTPRYLTRTPSLTEFPARFTPDSREVLVTVHEFSSRIMAVPVGELLATQR